MYCVKNEPAPRRVHLNGKMGIAAFTGIISAMCLIEVSGGGKAVCIDGPVVSVVVQVCYLQCGCLHVQVTGMAMNSESFKVVDSSESDTERALDLCSARDSPHCSAASTESSPMFVTPEFATFSPESSPLIHTPGVSFSPESGPSYIASAIPSTPSQRGLTTDNFELILLVRLVEVDRVLLLQPFRMRTTTLQPSRMKTTCLRGGRERCLLLMWYEACNKG